MRQPTGLFDPGAVDQRYDLSGPAKILLPFAIDLWSRQLRWYDVNLSAAGYNHQIAGYAGQLARLGDAMEDVYAAGHRVSLWELCCWHAAARTTDVVVRCTDGSIVGYTRPPGEEVTAFARRIIARLEPDRRGWPPTRRPAPTWSRCWRATSNHPRRRRLRPLPDAPRRNPPHPDRRTPPPRPPHPRHPSPPHHPLNDRPRAPAPLRSRRPPHPHPPLCRDSSEVHPPVDDRVVAGGEAGGAVHRWMAPC